MNNKLLLVVLLAAILGSGFFLFRSSTTSQPQPVEQEQAMEEKAMEEEAASTYTLDEVRAHDSADDCWLVIHGKVYDVTGFEKVHGGGEAVLEGCGLDATELYETRPMGSGTPHSEEARSYLPNFFIGNLAE